MNISKVTETVNGSQRDKQSDFFNKYLVTKSWYHLSDNVSYPVRLKTWADLGGQDIIPRMFRRDIEGYTWKHRK